MTRAYISKILIFSAFLALIILPKFAVAQNIDPLLPTPWGPPTIGTFGKPVDAAPLAPVDQPVPLPLAPVKKKNTAKSAPPRETVLSNDPTPTLQPETFFSTAKASERYSAIVDAGGWPEIPGPLKPGATGKAVAQLRIRLTIEGDLPNDPTAYAELWTPELTAAVKHFQSRFGLRQTGIVAGATLQEMNVPAIVRFRQLASSAQRLAGLSFPYGERYVVVNLPSASVEAVENGVVVHRYAAVAGDVEHRSPEETARIVAINLNPTWTLPTSIIKNEVIPKMRQNPNYLSRAHIRIFNGNNEEVDPRNVNWNSERATLFTLRQDSGTGNSLGNIRIQMPNKDAVYMHDTPAKSLFAGDYRFFSHGCVRVQGVFDLAQWLLEGTGGSVSGVWDVAELKAAVATQERQDVKLQKAVPVAWVYLTGWANGDGEAHFRPDVYGLDAVGTPVKPEVPKLEAPKFETQKPEPALPDTLKPGVSKL